MVVGYAAFNTKLEIKGTSKVTSNWDIRITNVTDGTPIGGAENTVKPSWTNLTASMEANLYDKGDAMEYDVTIENKGTLDAKLNDILTNLEKENNEAVLITFSGYTKGEVLKARDIKIIHVKIEYNPEYEGGETSSEVEINFEYTQNNKDPNEPAIYLLAYDCTANGGTACPDNDEYIMSGSAINLNKQATKEGWTFIGWNTNKDAKTGMTNYQMPEGPTVLYAIYSKDLKATYLKENGVVSIGKTEDTCTIYNNETSCEITLPTITANTYYLIEGWYDENIKIGDPNSKYNLKENITLSAKVKEDIINLDISTSATTNSITVVADATADSGIVKYEYRINGGEWIEEGKNNTYTFTELTANTSYNIEVRVTSETGKTLIKSKEVISKALTNPTFEEKEEGKVTIIYPDECLQTGITCTYQKDDGEIIPINEKEVEVIFGQDGTVVATVSDNINETSNVYNLIRKNLYVSALGNDETGYGTREKPYRTLEKAYTSATDTAQATIYIMTDIEQATPFIMDLNKNIILTSHNEIHNFIKNQVNTNQLLVLNNGSLTLKNITLDGNNIISEKALIDSFSVLNIEDGTTIKNAIHEGTGGQGCIYAYGQSSILTMNGGVITNNKGNPAALGIYEATFIMNGGTITNNTNTLTGYNWGNIYLTQLSAFEVHGGNIYNNISISDSSGTKFDNIIQNQMTDVITKDYTLSPTFVHHSNKYKILSAVNNTSVMSIEDSATCNPILENCNVWLYGNNNTAPSQDWGIGLESIVEGKTYYKFYNLDYSNKCLDVANNGTDNSTNIQIYPCNSSDGQRFYLEPAGNDYYYIKHKTSGKCVDVSNGNSDDGTNIQLYTCNNTNSQKWKFTGK